MRTSRARLRSDDVVGELEGVHGGRTAHEANQGALDRRVEPEPLNELLVEPRCREPSAGCDDQMRDIGSLIVDSQRLDAAQCQLHRVGLEALHAGSGAGKVPRAIEAVAVGGDRRRFVGLEDGISVFDFGALDHAPEHKLRFFLGQDLIGEADEAIMHVAIRNRGSNPIDVGDRHHASSRPRGFCNYRISIPDDAAGKRSGYGPLRGRSDVAWVLAIPPCCELLTLAPIAVGRHAVPFDLLNKRSQDRERGEAQAWP